MAGTQGGALARDAQGVLQALVGLPGGAELLELAAGREDVALVGGAVRDLLLAREPRELDVVVGEGAAELAGSLAARLGARAEAPAEPEQVLHPRFGTALVRWAGGRIDIATRRAESYPAPGALPRVREGSAAEDLERRDFTLNALAVTLGGPRRGELEAVAHGLEDLAAGRLRVLHERSFLDDPTRLLRLARYRARLGFEVEPGTAALARRAIESDALETVSRSRVGAELRLALAEPDPLAALAALDELGVLARLRPGAALDAGTAQRTLALLPGDGDRGVALLGGVLLDGPQDELLSLLDSLELPAAQRDRVIAAATRARGLAASIEDAERPSELQLVLAGEPPEAVALAGAIAGAGSRGEHGARSWLEALRDVRLEIDGSDLLAAGIAKGPEIGRRLAAALAARLDGELAEGRAAELAAALEASV